MFSNFLCTVGAAIALALPPVVSVPAVFDPVIAVINGTEIHRSTIVLLLHILPQTQGMSADTTLQEQQILDYLIAADDLRAEVQRQTLDQDPEIKTQLAKMERYVLRHAYQAHIIESKITDTVLKDQYERAVKSLSEREVIRVSYILLRHESEAEATLADIWQGADFTSVAREQSREKSKDHEEDLGFPPKKTLPESSTHAIIALQLGQISAQPVRGRFGWHVNRLEARHLSKPNFEDVEDNLQDRTGPAEACPILSLVARPGNSLQAIAAEPRWRTARNANSLLLRTTLPVSGPNRLEQWNLSC